MTHTQELLMDFYDVWDYMVGLCEVDDAGGTQFCRVLAEWIDAGMPDDNIGEFISLRSN